MKKTNKSNPLKTFNDNKAMAYKKAGGEMAAYKKSLIKGSNGRIVGPKTEVQDAMSNLVNYQPPVPRANIPNPYEQSLKKGRTNVDSINEMTKNQMQFGSRDTQLGQYGSNPRSSIDDTLMEAETYRATSPSNMRSSMPNTIKGVVGGENMQFTPEQLKTMGIYKNGGRVKKNLKRAENGTSVGPSFSDKIKLAAKRVGRNVTNRKAVNQLQRSSKVFDSDRSKSDALYNKAEATYNKAVDKNKAVNKFKREQGFAPGGDGTYFGTNKYSKPGPIISKQKKGGPVKRKKK